MKVRAKEFTVIIIIIRERHSCWLVGKVGEMVRISAWFRWGAKGWAGGITSSCKNDSHCHLVLSKCSALFIFFVPFRFVPPFRRNYCSEKL